MDNRPSFPDTFLKIAKIISERGTCTRGNHGAVIVKDNRIISTGYTGSPSGSPHCTDIGCHIDPETGGCIRTLHAESNAIGQAAKNGIALNGTTMYCTMAPCLSCAKLILQVGIVAVVYSVEYRDKRGIEYLLSNKIRMYHEKSEE